MDLKRSQLNIKIKVTKEDGSPVSESDVVALVNLPLHSVFSHVDCQLQQKSVSDLGTNYPYKAYIDTVLSTNSSRRVDNTSQLFIKDTGGQFDDVDAKTGGNIGLFERWKHTRDGKLVDLLGPLLLDFFQQDRLILNGVTLDLNLWPSKNVFRFMSDSIQTNEKLKILDATLRLCIQRPNPALTMAHAKRLEQSPALHPYISSSIQIASIAEGEFSFSADNMFQGEVPSQHILGLVSSSAYVGNYKRSPFNFQNFDCKVV